ncbi:MAG: DciA family protein [Candidatus Anammoxibacter sp.]
MQYYKNIPDKYYYNKSRNIKRLSDVFNNIGLYKIKKKKKLVDDDVLNVWEKFMDDNVKQHGKISSIRNGVVCIEVDSHSWLHHFVNFCKQDMLNTFQREVNRTYVSDIKFKLTSGS